MQMSGLIFRAHDVMNIVYIVSLEVSLGFSRVLEAERQPSPAARSRSDAGAEAGGSQLQGVVMFCHAERDHHIS